VDEGEKMLWELYFLFNLVVMVSYTFRHYVFSFAALKHRSEEPFVEKKVLSEFPLVSILVPAHNEERVIGRLLQRLTELTYPKDKFEVIVINDHSEDATSQIVKFYVLRYPGLIKVVNRDVGGNGKAEALNVGLRFAVGKFIGFLDADYVPQRDILEKTVPYFSNPRVGIVQGRVSVLNARESWIAKIVALERIGGYRVSQYARDRLGLVPQFAGTVGLVRRDLLLRFGGFNPDVLAEDTDLTFKVRLAGYKVKYVNDAESGEEGVIGLRQYWNQRSRWAKGHMQCAFEHTWPLLRSKRMSLKEKIDGLMLLSVYFVPLLVMLSWFYLFVLFLVGPPTVVPFWLAVVISVFFTLNGYIAPFLEVIAGAICDGRKKLILYTPLLFIAYVVNVCVCCKAFLQLVFAKLTGRRVKYWNKTVHNGGCEV
jgi:cellulose synthase/poly-beta-1,6-N-acetylglucosamine synthase-like glycosyltransferase